MLDVLLPAGIGVAAIVVIGIIFTLLYKRSTRDEAFVRTGLGGKKVVLDGGAIILPIFHSTATVNLKTLRLTVERKEKESLITKDRLRVDIGAEFYVRVKPDTDSIALAAQTLGERTNDAEALREQVEAKFVDGLRSVAATMSILDLQEKRSDFVKAVQSTVEADVQSNGLELESVSLTKLDQTDITFFNQDNYFDAEGLTILKSTTENKRKERNDIVRDTEVAIAEKDLQARQKTLTIEFTKKDAELSQERDVANKTAETRADIAKAEQTAKLTEETARIDTEKQVATSQAVANQAKETAVIEADLAVSKSRTNADRDIKITMQDNEIQIADKSKETSKAVALAKEAEAGAVSAEEKVTTARAVEIADRTRQTEVLSARTEAEKASTGVIVAAEAQKKAAIDNAEAIKTEAQAEADANKIRAEGIEKLGQAEAKVIELKNEAQNKLGDNIIDFELAKQRIQALPETMAEMVKPISNIKDVRILHTGGFGGNGNGNGGQGGQNIGFGDGLAGELLKVHAFKPIIDQVLQQAGFKPGDDPVKTLASVLTSNDNGGQAASAGEPAPSEPAPGAPVPSKPAASERAHGKLDTMPAPAAPAAGKPSASKPA